MTVAIYSTSLTSEKHTQPSYKGFISSGKSYSLVGIQDTDKAVRHTRLSADNRKRLSSLTSWKPQGHSVSQVRTADFFIMSFFYVGFYEHIP